MCKKIYFSFERFQTGHVMAFFKDSLFLKRRSEEGPRLNHLWTLSAPGAGKGLFRPRTHASSPHSNIPY